MVVNTARFIKRVDSLVRSLESDSQVVAVALESVALLGGVPSPVENR